MPELVEPKNVYGDYPGEWAEGLGGLQLVAAEELFPEYPEEIMEWNDELEDTEDQLLHYATLIQAAKDAYFQAAKIADELVKNENDKDPKNFDQLVKNYQDANKRYRERLAKEIKDLQAKIENNEESIAKFNQGLPQLDIAIARAENELRVEKEILKGLKQALSYAKENLDRILEYMKSLDGVNFVIPDFTTPTSTTTLP
jgi:chromosome segregation ATPase